MFKKIKKISTKLIITFIVVALISSIAGVVGLAMLKTSDTRYSKALIDYGFSQGYIGRLGMMMNENRAYIRDIVFLTDKAQLDSAYQSIQENMSETAAVIELVRPTNTSDVAKELFAKIEKELAEYQKVRDEVIKYGMSNDQDSAYRIWNSTASPMINAIVLDIEKLLDMNVEAGELESIALTKQAELSMLIMAVTIGIGLLVSVLIAFVMSKSIAKPVIEVQKAALQLANGDLGINISSDQADEVGQMTHAFAEAAVMMRECITDISRGLGEIARGNFDISGTANYKGDFKQIEVSIEQIIESLSYTLGQINQASDQVASGSDQVSSGAQELSQGATEQASSIEELSATISEISEQVRGSAKNAATAKIQSEKSGEEVEESNQQMQRMIVAMNDISNKSSDISKIIKSIEDIAFQTNILALNAAVEAARAGAAGKGFAVVADEVRNLAGKSAEAAKNTTALIEETVAAVGNGTKIADGTAQAMLRVVEGTKVITGLIEDIAKASVEQSSAVNQVTVGVEQISAVVQTNSATAEQSAAASEELSGQAQTLKELVSKFTLKGSPRVQKSIATAGIKIDLNDYSGSNSDKY